MYWKDLANAVAHGGLDIYCREIKICCERCKNSHMLIISHECGEPLNHMQDIILERRFYLMCPVCGCEQAEQNITIIPSWIWHPLHDDPNIKRV